MPCQTKARRGGSVQHTGVSISDGALHEAVAVCLSFGAVGRIPRDFQCAFARYGGCLDVGMSLSAYETDRSAGLDLAVVRLCGTQQTIYFSTGNHDPSALSNRFDCAPVELAVSPGLMFPK